MKYAGYQAEEVKDKSVTFADGSTIKHIPNYSFAFKAATGKGTFDVNKLTAEGWLAAKTALENQVAAVLASDAVKKLQMLLPPKLYCRRKLTNMLQTP